MSERIFKKNGYYIMLNKDIGESQEQFTERGIFIVSQISKNEDTYDNSLIYSRIFRNVKYYKCEYDEYIMNKLKVMENNMYDR